MNRYPTPTVASDPNATLEELDTCAAQYPVQLLENPVLDLYLLSDPGEAHRIWTTAWTCWLDVNARYIIRSITKKRHADLFYQECMNICTQRGDAVWLDPKTGRLSLHSDRGVMRPQQMCQDAWNDVISTSDEDHPFDVHAGAKALRALEQITGRYATWPKVKMRPNGRRR